MQTKTEMEKALSKFVGEIARDKEIEETLATLPCEKSNEIIDLIIYCYCAGWQDCRQTKKVSEYRANQLTA